MSQVARVGLSRAVGMGADAMAFTSVQHGIALASGQPTNALGDDLLHAGLMISSLRITGTLARTILRTQAAQSVLRNFGTFSRRSVATGLTLLAEHQGILRANYLGARFGLGDVGAHEGLDTLFTMGHFRIANAYLRLSPHYIKLHHHLTLETETTLREVGHQTLQSLKRTHRPNPCLLQQTHRLVTAGTISHAFLMTGLRLRQLKSGSVSDVEFSHTFAEGTPRSYQNLSVQAIRRERDAKRDLSRANLIAHRGHLLAPENSLAAIRLALQQGFSMVEIDVQISKDGVPVIIHDPTITRTVRGRRKLLDKSVHVNKLTLAQLKQLQLKDESGFYGEERIPSLREALDLVHTHNGACPHSEQASLLLDLKTLDARVILNDLFAYERKYGTWPPVFIQHYSTDTLRHFATLEGQRRPLLRETERTPLWQLTTRFNPDNGMLRVHGYPNVDVATLLNEGVISGLSIWAQRIHLRGHPLTVEVVDQLQKMGFLVTAWTTHVHEHFPTGPVGRLLGHKSNKLVDHFGLDGVIICKKGKSS